MEAKRLAADPYVLTQYRRVLSGQFDQVHLFFDVAVLNRYLGEESYQISRTDSAGTLKRAGAWALAFGIVSDTAIHVQVGELAARLPESERDHWLQHMVALPHSRHFVRVRMSPGSCFADGDIRPW
jgi:hypothetical protein